MSAAAFRSQALLVASCLLLCLPGIRAQEASTSSPANTQTGFLKPFTVDSYGLNTADDPGYEFSPGYIASFLNRRGFECPLCVPGLPVRTRFTIPPFGTTVTRQFFNDRARIFASLGGRQAFKPDGTFEPHGRQLWTSNYGDAWLTHAAAGANFAVDKDKRFRLGALGSHMQSYGSGKKQWNTVTGSATFTFGH